MPKSNMDGIRKAAIFILTLGDAGVDVLKHMDEDKIETVMMEVAMLDAVSPEERREVVEEFSQMMMAKDFMLRGGIDYAREMLSKAIGEERALIIIRKMNATIQAKPFEFLRRADANQLYTFIANEHPQIQALILTYLKPEQASAIIQQFPGDSQVEIVRRIAEMERASPEIVHELEQSLSEKFEGISLSGFASAGGVRAVVDILNNSGRTTEKTILEGLEKHSEELAQEIKKRMFVFEDIIFIDDRSLQSILRDIQMDDLATSLKAVSDDVKEKIFRNVSKAYKERLMEEIEYMGPIRLSQVEEAQERIVSHIRRLEEDGEIVVARGGQEDVLV